MCTDVRHTARPYLHGWLVFMQATGTFANTSALNPLLAYLANDIAQSNNSLISNGWHIITPKPNARNPRRASNFY